MDKPPNQSGIIYQPINKKKSLSIIPHSLLTSQSRILDFIILDHLAPQNGGLDRGLMSILDICLLHAGIMVLVFNPSTGQESPQYHVVFVDELSTVNIKEEETAPFNWSDLMTHSSE